MINPDKTLSFTPGASFSGSASVNYNISDGKSGTSSGVWTITVAAAPNHAPVANNDSGSVQTGSAITIDVLANDTDADGNALTIGMFTQGAHGTVTKVGNTLRYTPTPGYVGSDSFTYYAYDGAANSLTPATVSMTVSDVAPVAGGAFAGLADMTVSDQA